MPELPEVESVVRQLRSAGLGGTRIRRARVFWDRTIQTPSSRAFERALRGARIAELRRRGKFVVLELGDGRSLLIHLRMTGQLRLEDGSSPRRAHEQVILDLEDGRTLRFRDPRKFGRWYLLDDAETKLGELGPEPLSEGFTGSRFEEALCARRGALKPLLLDQRFLAGLGNIYVDEALFRARLHPLRGAGELDSRQARALYRAVRKVLREGIAAEGTSLGRASTNYRGANGRSGRNQVGLRVFRRTGEPCPRCRTPIERIVVGQRGTHFCPKCQS